jgi:hypothetical protein
MREGFHNAVYGGSRNVDTLVNFFNRPGLILILQEFENAQRLG